MCKEEFKEINQMSEMSEITICEKLCGAYCKIMTIYFFLNKEGKINHSASVMLRSFNEHFGLRDYDITVKHNKKSRSTKEEERKALFEFLGELTK